MAIGPDHKAALVAFNRFSFGARGGAYAGDLARAASDPRGFLRAELLQPAIARLDAPALPPTKVALTTVFADQEQKRKERERLASAKDGPVAPPAPDGMKMGAAPPPMSAGQPAAPATSEAKPKPPEPPAEQKLFRAEAQARFQRVVHAQVGFVERLVHFWSNHFCVSAAKGGFVRACAGSFEREAIRPHVLGRFADMLRAVEQHPAMLFFLDNQQSLGPDSRAGVNRNRGLNENLAREIMELHTLGVGGGYSQDDVTSLARIITGWTYAGRQGQLGTPGTFVFNANAHQPGAQRVMGKIYEANGVAQGEAVLADIARHPSTAKFVAAKFARHFVADEPPPALVARLQDVFTKSDGDLKALAVALLDSDEAWQAPLTKVRSPYEFLVASGRLLARNPEDPGRYLNGLNVLGQPLWSPAGPNGFPDTNAAWAAPEGMKLRLDISAQFASTLADRIDPRDLLELVAADAASADTRRTIERAESRQQALALLLMSPEFQRR
jgi:uncharacterized protein (DUF1800 family)